MSQSLLDYMSSGPWHTPAKPNCLGTFTVFHGAGEHTFNQVCQCDNLSDALAISALRDLIALAEYIKATTYEGTQAGDGARRALAKAKGATE